MYSLKILASKAAAARQENAMQFFYLAKGNGYYLVSRKRKLGITAAPILLRGFFFLFFIENIHQCQLK